MDNQVIKSYTNTAARGIAGTLSTRPYSTAFGTSKKAGKNIWELLTDILPEPHNKETKQALDIALYQWLLTNPLQTIFAIDTIPFLTGFQFNEEFTLKASGKNIASVNRNIDNTLQIDANAFEPAKDILAPINTKSITFKLMAVSYNIKEGIKGDSFTTSIEVLNNEISNVARKIQIPFTAKQGYITIVALAIEYNIIKDGTSKLINDLRWMPASIIWAGYN